MRVFGIFIGLVVGVFLGCGGGGGGSSSVHLTNEKSPFGISPSSLNYYSVEYTFIDAFKQSSRWQTTAPGIEDTHAQDLLDLDENGWIKSFDPKDGSDANYTKIITYIQLHNHGHNPKGQYVVLYEGEGNFTYGFDVKRQDGSTQGRDIINITGDTPLTIRITSINEKNYLRNIRVIRPGGICNGDPSMYAKDESSCDGNYTSLEKIYDTQVFHPMFINELKQYGVIRGMVMQETPSNPYETWETRPKITDARWTKETLVPDGYGGTSSLGHGMPFELLIKYANIANTDPWIDIPPKVGDEYIQKMANYVKENLNAKRKVYLEYYDEAWNQWGTYSYGGNWMKEKAKVLWASDTSSSDYDKLLNWYGMRTSQICKIFKDTFGSEKDRVKCTMNSQAANAYVSETMLGCPIHVKNGGEVCANNIDYLSIAPYFGDYIGNPETTEDVAKWSLDDLFQEINHGGVYKSRDENGTLTPEKDSQYTGGSIALSKRWMEASKKVADRFNVKLIAYEGGQHLASLIGKDSEDRKKMVELFTNAQRDGRMYDAYMKYLSIWKEIGGELFVAFESITRYGGAAGSWGNKEYQEQSSNDSPKAKAFIDFQVQNPCWWDGCGIK